MEATQENKNTKQKSFWSFLRVWKKNKLSFSYKDDKEKLESKDLYNYISGIEKKIGKVFFQF